jgi:hypothetical protein
MLPRTPTPPDPPTLDEPGASVEAESPPRVISPRMRAVLQKVDADHAEHLADLRAQAQRDADVDGAERAARKARAGKWAAGTPGPKKLHRDEEGREAICGEGQEGQPCHLPVRGRGKAWGAGEVGLWVWRHSDAHDTVHSWWR